MAKVRELSAKAKEVLAVLVASDTVSRTLTVVSLNVCRTLVLDAVLVAILNVGCIVVVDMIIPPTELLS